MKRKVGILLSLIICMGIVLCGCKSGERKQEETVGYADGSFMTDLSKGLQNRWKLNNQDEQKEGYDDISANSEEYKNMMLGYINAELDMIEKYKNEKFENNELQEIAIKYIDLLNRHKEICEYITVDYDKYNKEFKQIYNERSKVIKEAVEKYGLTVNEEYQSTLNEFLTNAKLVEEAEKNEESINKMLEEVQFQEVSDDGWGWKKYQAVMENTTEIDFKSFNVNINLLDEEGVILETTYDQVSALNKGMKAQLEFMTDKEFVSTQVICSWWE